MNKFYSVGTKGYDGKLVIATKTISSGRVCTRFTTKAIAQALAEKLTLATGKEHVVLDAVKSVTATEVPIAPPTKRVAVIKSL
jgi:hypothetical protein